MHQPAATFKIKRFRLKEDSWNSNKPTAPGGSRRQGRALMCMPSRSLQPKSEMRTLSGCRRISCCVCISSVLKLPLAPLKRTISLHCALKRSRPVASVPKNESAASYLFGCRYGRALSRESMHQPAATFKIKRFRLKEDSWNSNKPTPNAHWLQLLADSSRKFM